MPCSSSRSLRAPDLIQTPSATVSMLGMVSVATVMPFDRRLTSTPIQILLPNASLLRGGLCNLPPFLGPREVPYIAPRASISPASQAGRAGSMPQAASTAAGNFAGCAVASTTIGVCDAGLPARHMHGGRRMRVEQVAVVLASVARMVSAPLLAMVARPASNSARMRDSACRLDREGAGLLEPVHVARAPCRRRARPPRTAAARNSTRSGCPSTARSSRPRPASRSRRSASVRARMSLSLVAMTSRSIGRPMRLAA